jgi:hypothetical protein
MTKTEFEFEPFVIELLKVKTITRKKFQTKYYIELHYNYTAFVDVT